MSAVGRPVGRQNGERMIMPWRPLSWKPLYETMVALHCVGFTNKEIAERYEYSPVQVGNIIRSPEAQKIIHTYKDSVRNASVTSDANSLSDIKSKAIERVKSVINDETLAADHPFRVAEFSASILKGLGSLSDNSSSAGGPAAPQNNIFIGNDIASKLLLGMEKAAEARLLNAIQPAIEIDIVPTKSLTAGKTEIVVE